MAAVCVITLCSCGQRETTKLAQEVAGGDTSIGRHLIYAYGCGSCHIIPRVAEADGTVGPPLEGFASRVYIAGLLVNTPENLFRWVTKPQEVDPETAMPDLGVSERQAHDHRRVSLHIAMNVDAPEIRKLVIKTAGVAIAAFIVLEIAGGLLFMTSGTYNIAADEPHFKPVRWLLKAGRTRSVEFRSRGMHIPNLRDPSLLRHGILLYRKNCQPCHGAPGAANEQVGRGIDPKPPPLVIASSSWTDSELFWIIAHGLKLSGMPGFAPRLSETDVWGIVAFLRRMALLSPVDYSQLSIAADAGVSNEWVHWASEGDYGFAQLRIDGNSGRGRELLGSYGCIACHTVPGMGGGRVGPPLTRFAERQYIAGSLVNVPSNAVAWITNPKRFKPKAAMPNLNVQPAEALHIAAYLYTLGSSKRLSALQQNLGVPRASH